MAAGLLGLALAAVQLVPFAELLAEGNRPWRDASFAASGALPLRNLASLLLPSETNRKFYWEMNLFSGLLAPVGIVALATVWRDRAARTLAIVAAGGLLLALEPPVGIPGWLAPWFPGAGALRLPSRYVLTVGWACALIALVAWQRRPSVADRLLPGASVIVHLAGLLWAVHLQAGQYAWSASPPAEQEIATQPAIPRCAVPQAAIPVHPAPCVIMGLM